MAAAYDDGDDHYSVLGLPSGEEGAKLTLDEIRKPSPSRATRTSAPATPPPPPISSASSPPTTPSATLPTRRLLDARIRGRASGEPYYNKRRRGDEEDPIESYRQRAARRRHSEQAEAGHAAYYKRRPCDEDDPKEEAYRRFLRWRMRKRAEAAARRCRENLETMRALAEAFYATRASSFKQHGRTPV